MPKRKFMVMKRTKGPLNINTGRGRRKTWRENGGKADFFYVSNESEAKEIDEVYGSKGSQDVWVREHGQMGHDATYHADGGVYNSVHNYFFSGMGVDVKVWVLKRGKLARTTKSNAKKRGYAIVSEAKKRPDISNVRDAQAAQMRGGKS